MPKFLIIFIFFSIICLANIVPVERDAANHALIGAATTKIIQSATKNDELTFWIMTGIFLGKEFLDSNKTGFNFNDLVYDYIGYGLIMYEIEL